MSLGDWIARGTSSIDNTVRMESQWQSPEMQKNRAGAAYAILKENRQTDEVLAVMTFFEQLGYLVKEKAIRAEAAWEAFSDW